MNSGALVFYPFSSKKVRMYELTRKYSTSNGLPVESYFNYGPSGNHWQPKYCGNRNIQLWTMWQPKYHGNRNIFQTEMVGNLDI